ncbi:MAG: hypothetical protein COW27_05205 [Nitrosopumilales archaeon CG15_BIG_FIL_POST_REV_8_21_14_020_37_12]|nr:MAG: hypothetical protein COW27_05205 [Nitrosopumilales archaeon CG15_BIG_FIL_POST_REV_8_21_14_020_37_12]
MRLTLVVLLTVLVVGGSVIVYGFLIQNNKEIENISPYEKLKNYKEDLEKINQYHQKILDELEQKIAGIDDPNLEQLTQEIEILKQVINDNKEELEKVIQKLSKMEPDQ